MNDNFFFDTSILVYAFDDTESTKHKIAKELVELVFENEKVGFVSNQVMAELFNVLTEKVAEPLSKSEATRLVSFFIDSPSWEKFDYNNITVKKALLTSTHYGVSVWDAIIAETVKEHGALEILTENEKDFAKIPGIKIRNPFKQ